MPAVSVEDRDHAALLLSFASSQPQSQCAVTTTPVSQKVTKPSLEPHDASSQVNGRQEQDTSPLLYVGVTLERPAAANATWGMTLFKMSNYLVVGNIQQDVMQGLTSWAWATTAPPSNGNDFRASFGPLYPTCLLQLVPGDVILSINGQSQFDPSICHAPRLDILAVRLETARRAARQVLCMNVENVEYRAAQAAFETMEPFLVNDESPVNLILPPITSFPKWLETRKTLWRESRRQKRTRSCVQLSDRAKKRRCSDEPRENKVAQAVPQNVTPAVPQIVAQAVMQNMAQTVPQYASYHDPLVFMCFKLERESVATPWGIHVSHHDRYFLGVGLVKEKVPELTRWGCATTSPISGALLNVTDECVVRSLFRSQPLPSRSALYLQEGDFILSVSGNPISSFASLSDIANHMSQATSLMIIAVRHRVTSEVAQRALCEGQSSTEVTSAAFRHLLPILYHLRSVMALLFPDPFLVHRPGPPVHPPRPAPPLVEFRNPLFQDDKGIYILFEDGEDFEDGNRAAQFLPTISTESFPSWLKKRKATWRERWNIRLIDSDGEWCDEDGSPSSVAADFWTSQGYSTFNDWLAASTFKWKQSFSWNREKREKLAKECEEIVYFPSHGCGRDTTAVEQGRHWLRIRKQQWRLLRRKRQRHLSSSITDTSCSNEVDEDVKSDNSLPQKIEHFKPLHAVAESGFPALSPRSVAVPRQTSGEMTIIDALLEEEERQQKALQERPPLDISFLFDAALGAPDDVVAHCLEFLPRSEHGKLLCVSTATSAAMKERDEVWRQLCPSHWILPRRPRKRWHEFYITKIYQEEKASRKWADDFLNKAADILFKQDNLTKIEKMVKQGEKRVDFNINYISGVVCERNSLLNLAVIYSRTKVVRWLVGTKGADIETYDRGGFTPLLNAAWGGDRQLVRYLLSHGADRTKIGLFHFFKPLNNPEFKGLNAEGWAQKRGHHQLADLIRLGL